jgi:hypothetical protein
VAIPHATTKTNSDEAPSSPFESSIYFVSKEDPAIAAVELGASAAKLIGGNTICSFHFQSRDQEHESSPRPGLHSTFL